MSLRLDEGVEIGAGLRYLAKVMPPPGGELFEDEGTVCWRSPAEDAVVFAIRDVNRGADRRRDAIYFKFDPPFTKHGLVDVWTRAIDAWAAKGMS